MTVSVETLFQDLMAVRERAPLIHNVTNLVVMQQTANALLALGASPVMAHAEEEIKDMARLAGAMVVNMGTLDAQWVMRMQLALSAAQACQLPCVFDPVGVGATPYRTQVAQQLIAMGVPLVIRGNASEIMALANAGQGTKGVDSLFGSDSALVAARKLASKGHTVVVSGAVDYVVNTHQQAAIHNGVPLMTKVVGLGCTATALIGAFCAVNANAWMASVHAMVMWGVVGEIAAAQAQGPGTFQIALLDVLYHLTFEQLAERAKVTTTVCANST